MSSSVRLSLAGGLLLFAIALGFLVLNKDRPVVQVQNAPAPPPLLVNYVVAAHPLPAGTLARDEDFATRSVASADLPSGAIVDSPENKSGLRGALVRDYLNTGDAVTSAAILRPRDRGFLASVLAPGMRAVSIAVDAVSGVSGLVWPGDHVDVVLTHEIEKANVAHRALSETVLSNIRVIGIDQEIVQGANGSAAGKVARTVTLQVLPEQVEQVTVAEHLGKLTLAMRSAAEPDVVSPGSSTFGGDVSPALSRASAGTTMKVIEGGKETDWSFRTGDAHGR
jgi:pilus assembly protein CpaB